jgi:hypothetical protein
MVHDLHTIAYLSKYHCDKGDSHLSFVVSDILAASRRNNQALGVTGALLLSQGWFAQILEGPLDAVETIFEVVQCDSRHRNIKVLYSKPLESRNFAQWSMAFSGASDLDRQTFAVDGMVDPDQLGQHLVKILVRLIGREEAVDSIV